MPYRAPVSDYSFLLNQVLDYQQICAQTRFEDAGPDTADAILTEAARMCEDVMAPLQRNGDIQGAVLENGVVRTSPGFADGYWRAVGGHVARG